MIASIAIFGLFCLVPSEGVNFLRVKRQNVPEQGEHVIDNIFNIPITAIKQTATAAQSFSPENSPAIDSVFQIPISTLEAVGNLVKATSGQRTQNSEELQRIRQERRDKILAQRERQRSQRDQIQRQRLQRQQNKRTIMLHNKDPFGLNALSNLLLGNHGFLDLFGGHGGHVGHGVHSGQTDHGGNGHQGIHGSHGSLTGSNQNTYEVHENVEEDTGYAWHGITAGIGTVYGSRPTNAFTIQNKIAPKEDKPNKYTYDDSQIQNKIAPVTNFRDRFRYEEEPPLQNKIAPKSNRIAFQS
ncbi:uncharacterized protein LOC128873433 [Hylaeus volcanicus]|uniref:uncharacterized protein LOC128873433 n=1 Tax=Hylaeus volcanicus TaxID=313075 RepID=UPI0023B79086|nr:uncharacterized protein LOC128873433 [Hylaeus volcanicus]